VTGEVKKKKKMGGAYPGQMASSHAAYQPPASAFQNGQATAHFVSYGGGNALSLVQTDGSTKPQHGGPASKFVKVTLPAGVVAGQTIHVRAPDGQINEIIVPNGFGPGSSFTVEFAPPNAMPPSSYDKVPEQEAAAINNTRPLAMAPYGNVEPMATPAPTNHGDDGFVSGFNNPNWTPPPQQAHAYSATHDPDIDLNAYPSSQAVPVTTYATAKPY
jgi:hypothetical protein